MYTRARACAHTHTHTTHRKYMCVIIDIQNIYTYIFICIYSIKLKDCTVSEYVIFCVMIGIYCNSKVF